MATKKKEDSPYVAGSAIDLAVASIKKQWGPTSVFAPGDEFEKLDRDVLPSGIPELDEILGNGGFIRGTLIEVFGPEGAGKTTIALQIMAEAQKNGLPTVFIDMENSLSTEYAASLGLDFDNLYLSQPSSMEEALDIAEAFIKSSGVGLICIDSLASLVPSDELEKKAGEQTMGLQARVMSQWMRKISPLLNKTQTTLMFTNQLREKIGGYGNPTTVPGGRAVKFYASYRIEVKVTDRKMRDGQQYGVELKLTMVKNKYNKPFQHVDLDLLYGEGVDMIGGVLNEAINLGFITKSGNWYTVNKTAVCSDVEEELRFNGGVNHRDWWVNNPDRVSELKAAIKALEEFDV